MELLRPMKSEFNNSTDSFWEVLVPQSHYRKSDAYDQKRGGSRPIDLRFKKWTSLSNELKSKLIQRVHDCDELITGALLPEEWLSEAKHDGHIVEILKKLGLVTND